VTVASLSISELRSHLSSASGLGLRVGPFSLRIHSPLAAIATSVHRMYASFDIAEDMPFADFHVSVNRPASIRRWLRPQVQFYLDGMEPFKPLPLPQAYAMLEWGLNWCISNFSNQYLVIHAGVLARGNRAVVMPAPPGSGKSTLCAGLVSRGWRLLSDELTLIDTCTGLVQPLPRPINLKNESIEVMRRFAPDAVLGEVAHDTAKGTVAHMQPPQGSVAAMGVPARPAMVVFPQYAAGATATLEREDRGVAYMALAENSFNYSLLGTRGFEVLTAFIDQSDCYRFSYADLDKAVTVFDGLMAAR